MGWSLEGAGHQTNLSWSPSCDVSRVGQTLAVTFSALDLGDVQVFEEHYEVRFDTTSFMQPFLRFHQARRCSLRPRLSQMQVFAANPNKVDARVWAGSGLNPICSLRLSRHGSTASVSRGCQVRLAAAGA